MLLGWLSVAAVLIALALGLPVQHDGAVIALAVAAGIGNLAVRRLHPDVWAGLLLVFVAALILLAGAQARFDLLLFLVLPFIAVTHEGRRLAAWLTAAAATFVAAMIGAPAPLDEAEIALHALLLIAAVILAVALARDTRRTRRGRRPRAGRGRARAGAAGRGPPPDQEQPPDRRRPAAARQGRGRRGLRRHRRADPLDQRRARPAGRRARRDRRRGRAPENRRGRAGDGDERRRPPALQAGPAARDDRQRAGGERDTPRCDTN